VEAGRTCSLVGFAYGDWCLQISRGIPVDFIAAAECFWLARGDGFNQDIKLAVADCRRPASVAHLDALYILGGKRELERGKENSAAVRDGVQRCWRMATERCDSNRANASCLTFCADPTF
jgi:hypothetical protein